MVVYIQVDCTYTNELFYLSGGWSYLKTCAFWVASSPINKQPTRKSPSAPDGQSVTTLMAYMASVDSD